MTTLFVVGLGLIGGSVARGARANDLFERIVGFDPAPEAAAPALASGVVDALAPSVVSGALAADLTLLATPVGALRCVLRNLVPAAGALGGEGRWVTDAGSVKCGLISAAVELFGAMPDWLVPGHPLAGSERSGLGAARADLFRDRKVLLCPDAATRPAATDTPSSHFPPPGATCFSD